MAVILNFPRSSGSVEPDDGIVSILERLLAKARAGDIQSIVVVAAGPDAHPACEMAMDRGHATAIVGTLCVAESCILKAIEVTQECV